MRLLPTDLKLIGHTNYETDGFLTILSSGPPFEQILLCEILNHLGYEITSVGDMVAEWAKQPALLHKAFPIKSLAHGKSISS